MKYSKIIEDKDIFDGTFTDYAMSLETGLSPSYLSLLRRGMRNASEEVYHKMLLGKVNLQYSTKEFKRNIDTSGEEQALDNLLSMG